MDSESHQVEEEKGKTTMAEDEGAVLVNSPDTNTVDSPNVVTEEAATTTIGGTKDGDVGGHDETSDLFVNQGTDFVGAELLSFVEEGRDSEMDRSFFVGVNKSVSNHNPVPIQRPPLFATIFNSIVVTFVFVLGYYFHHVFVTIHVCAIIAHIVCC